MSKTNLCAEGTEGAASLLAVGRGPWTVDRGQAREEPVGRQPVSALLRPDGRQGGPPVLHETLREVKDSAVQPTQVCDLCRCAEPQAGFNILVLLSGHSQ